MINWKYFLFLLYSKELGLSKEAMDALREHLEQHESTGDTVEEDWHLSQFWVFLFLYNDISMMIIQEKK